MNRGVIITLALSITGLIFWAAAAPAFDDSKRFEEVKIDDVTVAIRVPVALTGATRPIVPADLRALRKAEVVSYAGQNPWEAAYAIVVMIIPAEHLAEFTDRASKHASVQILSRDNVVSFLLEFPEGVAEYDKMTDKVVTALTPRAAIPK